MVYADILIILNFLVNYFLLLSVKSFLKSNIKLYRLIISALFGGVASLYIFLPQFNFLIEAFYKLLICAVMTFLGFGVKSIKKYLKAFLGLFTATFLYGGVMTAIWQALKPKGMFVKNSIVYFNISPLFIIGTTIVFYFTFLLINKIFKSNSQNAEKCDVALSALDQTAYFTAIVDSGNSIEDIFGQSEIIIADKSVYYMLFGDCNIEEDIELKKRYRIIPCKTVSGCNTLEAYRCDKADITTKDGKISLNKPILALSKEPICDGHTAILNPKIFN